MSKPSISIFPAPLLLVNHVANCTSTDVNFIASQAIARSQQRTQAGDKPLENGDGDEDSAAAAEHADAMAALERQARAPVGFVAASTGPEGGNRPEQQPVGAGGAVAAPVNPDAIDLDDEMDD